MRFINKIAVAGGAVFVAFAVAAAMLLLGSAERAQAQAPEGVKIRITHNVDPDDDTDDIELPDTYSTEADGSSTITYTIAFRVDDDQGDALPTDGFHMRAGTMTATTTLGTWQGTGTTVQTFQCLGLGVCTEPGITLTLSVGFATGTNTVVVSGGGIVAINSDVKFVKPSSEDNPASITVSGGGKVISGSSTTTLTLTALDGAGVGINGRTLLVSTDKGTVAEVKEDCGTQKSIAVGLTATDSKNNPGKITVVLCGSTTETGEATVTVTDSVLSAISTTTTGIFAKKPTVDGLTVGAPASLASGESVTVTVTATDADGNPIGRDHKIAIDPRAGVTSGQGSCVLTPPGPLAFIPQDSGTASTNLTVIGPVTSCLLIVTVEDGAGEAVAGVIKTVTVAVTSAAAPAAPAGTTGAGVTDAAAIPASGVALLVTSGESTADELVTVLGDNGCTASTLAITQAGAFNIFVVGAPDIVNAGFPASIAAFTGFFARCT